MKTLTVQSPIGPVTALLGEGGVRALGFTDDPSQLAPGPFAPGADAELVGRLAAYFDGDLAAIDRVPLDLGGSDWFGRVWSELRAIPAGETRTYAELAAASGGHSARAAGSACARNPVALLVPCHRAVGADGSLRGYAWGLERKQWLLEHEQI